MLALTANTEGDNMICRIYDVDGATLEQYDKVDQKVGTAMPEGAHIHIAGMLDGHLQVIEVRDSAEHAEAYMEVVGPALEENEVPEPTVTEFEVHNYVSA